LLKGLDTVTDIADWVQLATARDELLMLRGIGKKSVDYMRALCGHETIPVDRHWIRLVALAGVTSREYDYTRMVIERACREVGLPLHVADRGIWLLSQSC
jgi:endonuclease III